MSCTLIRVEDELSLQICHYNRNKRSFCFWNENTFLITVYISSVLIHTVPLTWCFLGSGDISCGINLIGPLICLLDLLVPSGSVSMAISASSLLAWSHSEHCLRRHKTALLNELYWFYYRRPKSLVYTEKRKTGPGSCSWSKGRKHEKTTIPTCWTSFW